MKNRVFGVLTPIATIGLMGGLAFVVVAMNLSSYLGAVIVVVYLTVLILIVMLIVSVIVYFKKKSEYALGILFGLSGILLLYLIGTILNFALYM